MEQIGNKLIQINVTDSSLPVSGVPDTGIFGGISGIVDGLSSTPITTILLAAIVIAIPLCVIAIVLSRLHHDKTRTGKIAKHGGILSKITIGLTPALVALAVVVAPVIHTLAIEPLDSQTLSITIDKARSLSASGTSTVVLGKSASSHADIFAALNNNFDGNLGTNLSISAASIADSLESVELSTTKKHIYTTGPVEAGYNTDFDITVAITENLPVGEYVGNVEFSAEYVEADTTVDITLWCNAGSVIQPLSLPSPDTDDEILRDGVYIGKVVSLDIDSDFTLPTPNELGLYGETCDSNNSEWGWVSSGSPNSESNIDNWFFGAITHYWPTGVLYAQPGEAVIASNTLPIKPLTPGYSIPMPQPDPSEEWYECYVRIMNAESDNEVAGCEQYLEDIDEWAIAMFVPWFDGYEEWWSTNKANQYDRFDLWCDEWFDWLVKYYNDNNKQIVFDGMEAKWEPAWSQPVD